MSVFFNPKYRELLTYTTPPPTKEEAHAVVNELFKKVKFKLHLEDIPCRYLTRSKAVGLRIHPLHAQVTKSHFYTLAATHPGMELFQRLVKATANAPHLKISSKENESQLAFTIQEITYDPNQIHYYLSRNSAGEVIFVVRKSPEVLLAHECIHALHYYEDSRAHQDRTNSKPVMVNMTDAEEQLTITGFGTVLTPAPKIPGSLVRANINFVDKLCENSFLFAMGLPPRISHLGVTGGYTFEDIVLTNAIGTLKELLAQNPSFATTKIGSEYPREMAQRLGNPQMAQLL